MADALHRDAVERLVRAIAPSGETKLAAFLFGRPGSSVHDRRFGTEIYVNRKTYTEALLFVREQGAPYLGAIAIGALWSMATDFLTENFWHIGGRQFLNRHDGDYADRMSEEDWTALADSMVRSVMFAPPIRTTLYPIIPLEVVDPFDCPRFFFAGPAHLGAMGLPSFGRGLALAPEAFPPFLPSDVKRKPVGAWLGVRAPDPIVAKKIAAAILGALALTPTPRHRWVFSGRAMSGGLCTLGDRYAVIPGGSPHTPAMMDNIRLTGADHDWLAMLPAIVDATDRTDRKKMRALEYFYRAWFLDPRERFPALCMALDSCVAVTHGHTAAAISFVKDVIGGPIDEARLRLLMRIRGAVIHGAAPDVYDSENYARYYVDYGADPVRDLELVVAKCLRTFIFDDALRSHANPDAAILAELARNGRAPNLATPEAIIAQDI